MTDLGARLTSRKLWLTIIASALVTLGDNFGIQLDAEQIITLGGMIVAYVTGEALIDRQRVQAEVNAQVDRLKMEANALIAALNTQLQHIQAEDANTELHQG